MYDIDRALDDQILAVMQNRPTVVLTEALDPRTVEAACHLSRFARLVFLADEAAVARSSARDLPHLDPTRVAYTFQNAAFVDPDGRADLLDEFVAGLALPAALRRADLPQEARDAERARPLRHHVRALRPRRHRRRRPDARAPDYFRPMLRLLRVNKVMCEAGIFVLPPDHPSDIFPHNIVVFGDVGVNATMTPETLAHCAVGHLRRGPRPLPRGRAADDQRRHRLLLAQGLGRGPVRPSWSAAPRPWSRRSWPSASPSASATARSTSRAR